MSSERPPLCLRLEIFRPDEKQPIYALKLLDEGREFDVDAGVTTLEVSPDRRKQWDNFLLSYVKGVGNQADQLTGFGKGLFDEIIPQPNVRRAWKEFRAHASDRPMHLTVEFGQGTAELFDLPIELLHDGNDHIFTLPHHSMVRTLQGIAGADFTLPEKPRLLFAWARPRGMGRFEPSEHLPWLRAIAEKGMDIDELGDASVESLEKQLKERDYAVLHLMAHGYAAENTTGIWLCTPAGHPRDVPAEELAGVLRGTTVSLVFLCSCQSARHASDSDLYSGVAQRVLAQKGARIACVVATQANLLPVDKGFAELVGHFYGSLLDRRRPAEALARARQLARGQVTWSVPILLARPSRTPPAPPCPTSEGQIQQLAVMYTDMADSTEYAQKCGDSAARTKQLKHNELLLPLLRDNAGTLIRTMGDALLAIFDDTISAARCGVAMQRCLHEYNWKLAARACPQRANARDSPDLTHADQEIHIRIGIHWGRAIVYRDRNQVDITGTAANVGARVESGGGKQTDQILVSESAFAQLRPHADELPITEFGTVTAKGVGSLRLYQLHWQPPDGAHAPLKLAAQTADELANRMAEADSTRGIHCLFIDPAGGKGYIRPLFVKVVPAEAGSIKASVEVNRVMEAAATRGVQAAFDVLERLGFRDARADRHAVRWWIEGPAARYEGASVGLGAALATAAAYAGVAVDRTVVAIGATDGERVVRVAGVASKWLAIKDYGMKTLVLPADNFEALPADARAATEPLLFAVATVEEALVEVLGPGLGLAGRHLSQAAEPVSPLTTSIDIEVRVEADRVVGSDLRAIGVRPRQRTWHVGEEIRILVQVSRDCHVSLVNIGTSGNVTILLPNAFHHDTLVRAGSWQPFPALVHGFALPLLGPPGVEKIVAVASAEPLRLAPRDFGQTGQFAELRGSARAIGIVASKLRDRVQGRAEIDFYVSEDAQAITSALDREVTTTMSMRGTPVLEPDLRSIDLD